MSCTSEKPFFKKMFFILCQKHKFQFQLLRFIFKRYFKFFDYSSSMPKYVRKRLFNKPHIKHLREILHFRVYYGDYSIKKFRRYLKRVNRRRIDFESSILFLLESRLDILLYRLNFFKHPREARVFVQNKNVLVNNKIISNLNHHLYLHEIVSIKKKHKDFFFKNLVKKLSNKEVVFNNPKYIEISYKLLKWFFISTPKHEQVTIPSIWEFDFNFLRGSIRKNK